MKDEIILPHEPMFISWLIAHDLVAFDSKSSQNFSPAYTHVSTLKEKQTLDQYQYQENLWQ
jgi:hypothetical protein